MANITYNIEVDDSAGTATVTTNPSTAKFKPGDKVSFVSDTEGTTILYDHGSPFVEDVAGKPLTIPTGGSLGPYTMDNTKGDFKCRCGRMLSGEFSAWEGGTLTTGGGGHSG